ncbi:MAG: 2-oxoglutarate dehydrogenase E1 component [Bacteroidetes bacterium]|nr:MAG: 2-oxoglutarate dehydrogenase E1 component [Bacteroidota bacterium]
MEKQTYITSSEISAVDDLYQKYLSNGNDLDAGWKKFFEGFEFARKNFTESASRDIPENVNKEFSVLNLINLYRAVGHLFTHTNPVRERRKYSPSLDEIELIGLSQSDMDTVFHAGSEIGLGDAKLRDIISFLKQTYCQSVGAEYRYIRNAEITKWLQEKMESCRNTPDFSKEEKINILNEISKAVIFESFLHTKFVGEKRFSLEGCEVLIPAMDSVIQQGASLGIKEFVIGMAHRGRLNVLASIMKKTYEDIFTEFEGKEFEESLFDGDVKYHQGYSSNVITKEGNKVHMSLTPNPSHLETVNGVVEGIARAKIDRSYDGDSTQLCPILIHGDSAIAGQGILYEIIQMVRLDAYKTGGTIHLVTNNQIGFTTNYMDARSSTYCTDIAKVTLSPVFHVNADDAEAVIFVVRLAMEFRQKFHRDVFIDLLGYRKYGHNEGDEPRFTQPLLYKSIASHANPREIYMKKLIVEGVVDEAQAKQIEDDFRNLLSERLNHAKQIKKTKVTSFLEGQWKGVKMATEADFDKSPDTAVDKKILLEIGNKITEVPAGKKFFNKMEKLFKDRKAMLDGDKLDWAMGELLAYGTLLNEGHSVRFSGQDVERGTFSHRHAVIKLEDSEEEYVPLASAEKNSKFMIYNSHLSEYAVLGFEYGYAMASPETLTIWEAQFGDFANCAQVIIDQYISAAEDKWRRMNGICLLLPHGYEGQGAEHSSARIERFLTLCAENNMYVINATTPANFFHALRRQLKTPYRKPLIAFTPKSLLRHPKCISSFDEFSNGGFKEIMDDVSVNPKSVKKLVFTFGKIYYDLLAYRETLSAATPLSSGRGAGGEVALIRIEQMYPFPKKQFSDLLNKYSSAKEFLWVQEEPHNMGAWGYLLRTVSPYLKGGQLQCIARPESASPATGSKKVHEIQQKEILEKVFKPHP